MTYGELLLHKNHYVLNTQPQVRIVVKRLLLGCKTAGNTITVKRTAESTENIRWILERWPHTVSDHLRQAMTARVQANQHEREEATAIIAGQRETQPPAKWTTDPKYKLRHYQEICPPLARIKRGLLIGDDIGLGKTATGIAILADNPGTSLVVCQKHLQRQWAAQIAQFCPALTAHILKTRKEYAVPKADVYICSYTKLADWADRFESLTAVVYDEVQELRHIGTQKHNAATALATTAETRIGLSATPVYNNAGEIFSVMEILSPGTLGTVDEFAAEWGSDSSNKWKVNDPEALGSWMRDQNIYIRRRRSDVGRELPPIHKINHLVEHDPKILDRLRAQCNELAEKVLQAGFHEKGLAARQLDILLRQTTGIAKAPFVADFVETMVQNGEKVLLAGWHREVYEIWKREFEKKEIKAALFTGSESENQKARAAEGFTRGDTQVLVMSLRSGAGLDGLQTASRTAVIGELDWSPQVIEQFVGRIRRDGQTDQVTVFTMMSDAGADPLMAATLAGKWEQSTALTDPDKLTAEPTICPENRVSELARSWLAQNKKNDP